MSDLAMSTLSESHQLSIKLFPVAWNQHCYMQQMVLPCHLLFLQLLTGSQPTWFLSLGATASDKERVAVIKKDTHNGAHSASMFLNSNTTQFFSQPVPDYQARGDVKNRSFFIYRGTMPVAEVRIRAATA